MDVRASNPRHDSAGKLGEGSLSVPPQSLCSSAIGCINNSVTQLEKAVDGLAESLSAVLSIEPKVESSQGQVAPAPRTPRSSLHGALLAFADRIDKLANRVADLRSRNTL